ncbi:MAG: hypothetical protein QOH76_1922 [Thermoleophilaceae bacterium]|nr:hypothetical protein [Thermoleophilaceae bacterium]
MAERGRNAKPDLTPDALAPAPGDPPPDTIAIYGILGKSPLASNVRLFLDVGFTTYYDIPIEGVVEREKVPADKSPLGVDSTLLMVRKGIQLVVHHAETRTVEEEFLAGDFTAPGSFAPAAGGLGGGFEAHPMPQTQLCPSHIGCPTQIILVCRPTLGIACSALQPCGGFSHNPCPTVAVCPTLNPPCGPISHNPCPSVQPCFTKPGFCLISHNPCPSVQPCHTHPPFCPPLSHVPCPTVAICPTLNPPCGPVTLNPPCGPISHNPCPSVQACHTQAPFCPIVSSLKCPSVGGCVTINCGGPLGGGGDPFGG